MFKLFDFPKSRLICWLPIIRKRNLLEGFVCHLSTVHEYGGQTDRQTFINNLQIEEVSGVSAVVQICTISSVREVSGRL